MNWLRNHTICARIRLFEIGCVDEDILNKKMSFGIVFYIKMIVFQIVYADVSYSDTFGA